MGNVSVWKSVIMDVFDFKEIAIFLVVFVVAYIYITRPRNLPPGPLALPLVGSLPLLRGDMRKVLVQLSKKYGNIYTIYIGNAKIVVLNGYDCIKDALEEHSFSGRPWTIREDVLTDGKGIAASAGAPWLEQRRHSHRMIKDMSLGNADDIIKENVHILLAELEQSKGQTFGDFFDIMGASISSAIAQLLFGDRFKMDNFLPKLREMFELIGGTGILSTYPYLKYLPGDMFRYKYMQKVATQLYDEYRNVIHEHKATVEEDNPTDFIYLFLKEIKRHKDDPDSTFNEIWLLHTVNDLFSAGFDTTLNTLQWGILFLLHNPQVQSKVQEEIDNIIGNSGDTNYKARTSLPYTMATISEIQRLGDVIPFALLHQTTEDVNYGGYHIPAGSQVLPNLYGVHHDPRYWDEPEKFNPDRFLDDKGNYKKAKQLVPFSIGKRICIGETLAQKELFYYLTAMLQRYTFLPPTDEPLPTLEGILGITFSPRPYRLRAVIRDT